MSSSNRRFRVVMFSPSAPALYLESQALELIQEFMLQKMHLSQIGPGRMPPHIVEVLDASTAMGITHDAEAREEHDVLAAFFGKVMFLGGRDCRYKRIFFLLAGLWLAHSIAFGEQGTAARVCDPGISAIYLATALRWRRMAEQQDDIDRAIADQRFGGIDPAK